MLVHLGAQFRESSMRFTVCLLALAATLPLSVPAQARELPDGGVTVGEFADALQTKGFKAETGKDATGDPKITSAADGSPPREERAVGGALGLEPRIFLGLPGHSDLVGCLRLLGG